MKVFISWSGEMSKRVGEAFKNWIPHVLQTVEPYYTPTDIEKGTRWSHDIAAELESSSAGIFCVTRENLQSSWLAFEAGAISKQVDDSLVCPVLIDLGTSDLNGPLTQFQVTPFQKAEIKKLIQALNKANSENVLSETILNQAFERNWPELEEHVSEIIRSTCPVHDEQAKRDDREVLNEILDLTRSLAIQKTGGFKAHNELNTLISNFLLNFDSVFNEDWDHTKICIQEGKYFFSPSGTFLNPKVKDEQNNWANRASLLNSYRELVGYIEMHQIDIATKF
ncbi:hypothetical protein B8W72_09750 [Pseudomonas putida]|uniref:TIR domain-containing protein n=1 Tax=Pseudomonas putida TaxID=303 RepID=A0A1Y3L946_PSEPU|nr:TIR domain-containing protein [Pseudomonas putida]OUM34737.1 hypothetical protein B8W72_09750 [Pseudomonas putida]